jgi:phosphoserine/homoserine phosphotransferase
LEVVCLDMEGVLVPEIWIGVAERTGIEALRLTTRDIPDYDELMTRRLAILREHDLRLADIRDVIGTLEPLPGVPEFLRWLRARFEVVILSDTFYEFAGPLLEKLERPTLFCNALDIDAAGCIVGYRLRQPDQKRAAVEALQSLNFRVIAAGDSYNDTSMLAQAETGILFSPPDNVVREFPQYPVTRDYDALRREIIAASTGDISP